MIEPNLPLLDSRVAELLIASNQFEGEYDDEAHADAAQAWHHLNEFGLNEAGLLVAHASLMYSRGTLEAGQKGLYRYQPSRVGDRLMPPAHLVPSLTRAILNEAAEQPSFVTADRLVKVHPFADGNGRIARLVLYHLNIVRNEPMELMSGKTAMNRQRQFVSWLESNYPECYEDCSLVQPAQSVNWPWLSVINNDMATL